MVISNYRSLLSYDYFDKLLRLENVVIVKTRQDSLHYWHHNLDIVNKEPVGPFGSRRLWRCWWGDIDVDPLLMDGPLHHGLVFLEAAAVFFWWRRRTDVERIDAETSWWTAVLEWSGLLPTGPGARFLLGSNVVGLAGWPAGWPVHHTRPCAPSMIVESSASIGGKRPLTAGIFAVELEDSSHEVGRLCWFSHCGWTRYCRRCSASATSLAAESLSWHYAVAKTIG